MHIPVLGTLVGLVGKAVVAVVATGADVVGGVVNVITSVVR